METDTIPTNIDAISVVAVAAAAGTVVGSASGIGWAAVGLGACCVVARRQPVAPEANPRRLVAFAAILALFLAVRRSPTLVAVNAAGVGGLLLAASAVWRFGSLRSWGPVRTSGQLLWATAHALVASLKWASGFRAGLAERNSRVIPAARGVALAAVPVFVFGALFASADAVFASGLAVATDLVASPFDMMARLMFAALVAGALIGLTTPSGITPVEEVDLPDARFETEVSVALWSMVALFGVFVGVQFSTLFGGQAFVLAASGLTMAEYARSGFFELVTVTALVLTIAYPVLRFARAARVRVAVMAILGLTVIVALSALLRMLAYVEAFGLTELRFYTSVFMIWLIIVLALVASLGWQHRVEEATSLALTAGLTFVILLNLVNPDGVIGRVNLAQAAAGAEVDIAYLTALSSDVLPTLSAEIGRADACVVAEMMQMVDPPSPSLLEWSWSDVRARATWPAFVQPQC